MNMLGHNINITPNATEGQPQPDRVMNKETIQKGIDILKKYKTGKANLENRIVENEKWYKMRHWELIRKKEKNEDPEPASAWLFNSLANKHADAMDNYPEPNILPREEMDEEEAQSLTDIIPLVMEKNEFEQTYNDAWWDKLKSGTSAYGIFWNTDLENGLGDIDITNLDLLNLFWEPGKKDLQKSRNFFIVDLQDDDILESEYPWLKGKLHNKVIDVKQYVFDDTVDTTNKSVVVDWYYKKKYGGKWCLHLTKFVGEYKLWSSEDDPEYENTGIYEHGMYPIFFDVLFPEKGMPVGFGYVDVMKNPQMYTDKLDQIISRNALQSGKKRWFIKDNSNVNEQEYADWSKDFVHVAGSLDEANIREIQISPLDAFIVNHRIEKINELKETSGNRDFNQGGAGGGVTAAAAIAALQEAGNKLARDMIKTSYRTYTKINYMCIELIRQFYNEERKFRIEGNDGKPNYLSYSNQNLKLQQLPPAFTGEGMVDDGTGQMIQDTEYQAKFRKPVFDIKIKPQKANPFSRMAQNELAKELYGAGFFDPMRADQSLIALELMDFEGKEKIIQKVAEGQTLMNQLQQMQQNMIKMSLIIQQLTGKDVLGENAPPQGQGKQPQAQMKANSNMVGMDGAMNNAQTPYAQKMVNNASANMNGGMAK